MTTTATTTAATRPIATIPRPAEDVMERALATAPAAVREAHRRDLAGDPMGAAIAVGELAFGEARNESSTAAKLVASQALVDAGFLLAAIDGFEQAFEQGHGDAKIAATLWLTWLAAETGNARLTQIAQLDDVERAQLLAASPPLAGHARVLLARARISERRCADARAILGDSPPGGPFGDEVGLMLALCRDGERADLGVIETRLRTAAANASDREIQAIARWELARVLAMRAREYNHAGPDTSDIRGDEAIARTEGAIAMAAAVERDTAARPYATLARAEWLMTTGRVENGRRALDEIDMNQTWRWEAFVIPAEYRFGNPQSACESLRALDGAARRIDALREEFTSMMREPLFTERPSSPEFVARVRHGSPLLRRLAAAAWGPRLRDVHASAVEFDEGPRGGTFYEPFPARASLMISTRVPIERAALARLPLPVQQGALGSTLVQAITLADAFARDDLDELLRSFAQHVLDDGSYFQSRAELVRENVDRECHSSGAATP